MAAVNRGRGQETIVHGQGTMCIGERIIVLGPYSRHQEPHTTDRRPGQMGNRERIIDQGTYTRGQEPRTMD